MDVPRSRLGLALAARADAADGGLSRKRHPLLKAVFKGAGTTVIAMPTHPLHEEYQRRLRAGTQPNLAKLTLARRIAAIVLSMWKHQEVCDPKRQNGVADEP